MLLKPNCTPRFVVRDRDTNEWLATLTCGSFAEAESIAADHFPGRRLRITMSL